MVDRREFLKGVAAVVAAYPGIHHLVQEPNDVITASEVLKLQLIAEGRFQEIILKLDNEVRKVMWPDDVQWPGGTEPVLTDGGIDIVNLHTHDGGENWFGAVALDMQ
jgi:hypothetical protein